MQHNSSNVGTLNLIQPRRKESKGRGSKALSISPDAHAATTDETFAANTGVENREYRPPPSTNH